MAIKPNSSPPRPGSLPPFPVNRWGPRDKVIIPLPSDPISEAITSAAEEGGELPKLLTPAQVAGILSVGVRTLERWRMTGEGPAYLKLSRKQVRYTEEALARFINRAEKGNTAE